MPWTQFLNIILFNSVKHWNGRQEAEGEALFLTIQKITNLFTECILSDCNSEWKQKKVTGNCCKIKLAKWKAMLTLNVIL